MEDFGTILVLLSRLVHEGNQFGYATFDININGGWVGDWWIEYI